ncbi:MAG: ATP-binding cassette domain-containing protein, partial [Shewanella sp.]|nr:ATP-binding cassette domain-containing protein [Shewanella sp.]MCF1438569.1 ATP-binding cassette domain-containing protein [Shewanella sp.]
MHPGQKVGITGANGTGKSSLFALILGQLHADEDELSRPDAWMVLHIAQQTGFCHAFCDNYLRNHGFQWSVPEGLALGYTRGRAKRVFIFPIRLTQIQLRRSEDGLLMKRCRWVSSLTRWRNSQY